MKKLFVLIPMLLFGMVLFSQDSLGVEVPGIEVPGVEVPEDVGDLLGDLSGWLGSFTLMVGVVIFLASLLITVLKLAKRWQKLVVGWVVAILLAALTNLLNFGLYAEATWLQTFVWGAGLGFVAGGIFDIPTTKTLINLLLSLIKLKKTE